MFVLPALAAGGQRSAIEAARESGRIARKRFGEAISGQTVIAAAFALLYIPVVVIGLIGYTAFGDGSQAFGGLVVSLAILLGLFLSVTQSAVDGVFRVALYDFAVDGAVMAPFTSDDLENGLRPKRRLLKR